MKTEPSIEYLAGYFDGEGCICMRHRADGRTHRLDVQLTTAYRPVLEALQGRFGGSIWATPSSSRNKPLYHWSPGKKSECLPFLRAIQPFSLEKQEQVATAIEWLQVHFSLSHRGPDACYDPEIAEQCSERLRLLKSTFY
jgi:hypothetical protein